MQPHVGDAMPHVRLHQEKHADADPGVQASSPEQAAPVGQPAASNDEASREELHALVIKLQDQVESLKAELAAVKQQQAPASTPPPSAASKAAPQVVQDESAVAAPSTELQGLDGLEKGINWPQVGSQFWDKAPRHAGIALEDISPPGQAKIQKDQAPLHIVHMTAEMAPVAKVGGLGDVVQGLAKASLEKGHHVEVLLPRSLQAHPMFSGFHMSLMARHITYTTGFMPPPCTSQWACSNVPVITRRYILERFAIAAARMSVCRFLASLLFSMRLSFWRSDASHPYKGRVPTSR